MAFFVSGSESGKLIRLIAGTSPNLIPRPDEVQRHSTDTQGQRVLCRVAADNINERGQIVVVGVPGRCFPDFCGHLFLLTPCAIDDEQGCRDKEVETNVPFQNNLQPMAANSSLTQVHRSKDRVAAWRTLMVNRYRLYPMGAPHDSK